MTQLVVYYRAMNPHPLELALKSVVSQFTPHFHCILIFNLKRFQPADTDVVDAVQTAH